MKLFGKKYLLQISQLQNDIEILKEQLLDEQTKNKQIEVLRKQLSDEKTKSEKYGIYEYEDAVTKISNMKQNATEQLNVTAREIKAHESKLNNLASQISEKQETLSATSEELTKQERLLDTNRKKLKRAKELCKAMLNAYDYDDKYIEATLQESEILAPSVTVELKSLTYQDLRKEYRENEKTIKEVLTKYESRYTTKANRTIYQLMVLALQAELQNILVNMKYDRLDKATAQVNEMCLKFANIASEGNQSIAPTIKRFIGEIEHLFINAVKIEHEYYVKKEREREEQAAIREQMRQEAEERKELERQKKHVEKEESKYLTEIENVKYQIAETEDSNKISLLELKIKELQEKLKTVEERKEDIINRQNGKAGNVYVISNLGSFGDNVFKVGMTRRLEPMDRVRELGDASVPFSFDVHAMIFSEDAVSLESKLHEELNEYRLNKVNLRKEFFKLPLEKIESIVLDNDPAASFNKTMLAEQYRQSLSM